MVSAAAPAAAQPSRTQAVRSPTTRRRHGAEKSCESLSAFKGEGIVAIQARMVAGDRRHAAALSRDRVISPEVAFEINLPDRWNQRFYMTGNGGLAGDALDGPTNAERTSALTQRLRDGAHQYRPRRAQGTERVVHPQQPAESDRLRVSRRPRHRGNGEGVATDYYAQPIKFSYWNSCSNGGRQGLLEAQRFPDDFDGIVANAPWVDQTGFTSVRSGIRRRSAKRRSRSTR